MNKIIAIALTTLATLSFSLPAADARRPLSGCQYDNSCPKCSDWPTYPGCTP